MCFAVTMLRAWLLVTALHVISHNPACQLLALLSRVSSVCFVRSACCEVEAAPGSACLKCKDGIVRKHTCNTNSDVPRPHPKHCKQIWKLKQGHGNLLVCHITPRMAF